MSFIKTPTKGMRDILPNNMELREYVLNLLKETYKTFGFQLIQTPTMEHIENLTSKQGGENEKLIFKILKRGEKLNLDAITNEEDLVDSALRYDLTVPLVRFYMNNISELSTPFRALQIGNVYRAERSQKGRYREFMQCDVDIIGEKTNLAEIELITAVITFLKKLDFKNFTIKINDRRILTSMIESANLPLEKIDQILIILDKMDKIGLEGIKEELALLDLEKESIDKYLSFFENKKDSINDFCSKFEIDPKIISNLEEIKMITMNNVEANIEFDPTLVRGMGYYTGPIFEIQVDDLSSAVGGGGRYDKMIEKFGSIPTPACGFSIGFERLVLILEERGFVIPKKEEKVAYIISSDTNLKNVYQNVNEDRKNNKIVKIMYRSKNFKFQKETLEKENYNIIEC